PVQVYPVGVQSDGRYRLRVRSILRAARSLQEADPTSAFLISAVGAWLKLFYVCLKLLYGDLLDFFRESFSHLLSEFERTLYMVRLPELFITKKKCEMSC